MPATSHPRGGLSDVRRSEPWPVPPPSSQLRVQLAIVAITLWTVALVNAWTPSAFLRSGQLKGTDFVHFYAFSSMAATGDGALLYDVNALASRQAALVPEAAALNYPPVNAPQIAVLFAPLASLRYSMALVVWLAVTLVVYLGAVAAVARAVPTTASHVGMSITGALAFPPFWHLIQHGQLSVIAAASIAAGWFAVRADRVWIAGACLGMLAYKPPLFVPVLAILLVAGARRIVFAMMLGGIAQIAAATLVLGWAPVYQYAHVLLSLPGMAQMMAAKPFQMHSLRTFWELLVPWPPVALALYAITALAAVGAAAWMWRRSASANLRMAALSLATVLAAPHLYVYDLTLLAPAFLWLVDWFVRDNRDARVGRLLYAAYLAPLAAPFVPFIRVQLSTMCFAGLLWLLLTHQQESTKSLSSPT